MSSHMSKISHIYTWVTSHIWVSHVSHMNESHHTCESWNSLSTNTTNKHNKQTQQTRINDVTHEPSLLCLCWTNFTTRTCNVFDSYVRHDSLMCATGLDMTCSNIWIFKYSNMRSGSLTCETSCSYTCDMTHSCVWLNPFICLTKPIHVCYMKHSYVWHDAFMCVTWRIHVLDQYYSSIYICDTASLHSHKWHCLIARHVTHMNESCHTHECVMSHTWMRHVTHMHESCHTHDCLMSRICTRHVTHMNASCHTYARVLWISHATEDEAVWLLGMAHI